MLQQIPGDGTGYLAVMHGGVPDEAQAQAAELRQELGLAEVPTLGVPPAIVTRGGPVSDTRGQLPCP